MTRKTGRTTKIASLDLNTGEIMDDGIMVYVKGKVRWHEGFFMGIQDAFIRMSGDREMTADMLRVWMNLLGRLGFENWIVIPQKEVAESVGMQRSNVSRAINKLVAKGLLIKGPKIGRSSSYKINSHYAWKGTIKNLSKDRMGEVKILKDELKKRELERLKN